MTSLTVKQEKFCQKYIETGNASEAYRFAYDSRGTDKTVWESASKLLADPKVAARVAELQAHHLKRHEITVDRVLKEYGKLAFHDIRKAFDENGHLKPVHELDDDTAAAIAGIDIVQNQVGGAEISSEGIRVVDSFTKKIKLTDKRAALDSIARHLGMFKDTVKIEHDYEEMTDDELITLARSKGIIAGKDKAD
jgi:phage terminase small subunit